MGVRLLFVEQHGRTQQLGALVGKESVEQVWYDVTDQIPAGCIDWQVSEGALVPSKVTSSG